MTNEEIDTALTHAQIQVVKKLAKVPVLGWLITLGVYPMLLLTQIPPVINLFEGTLILLSSKITLNHLSGFRQFKACRASGLWAQLRSGAPFYQEFSPSTYLIWQQISDLYKQDTDAEFLPLPQAVRLLNAHHQQQKRFGLVTGRLNHSRDIRVRLLENLNQLRALGSSDSQGTQNLASLDADTQALNALQGQIEASCRRLEMILISVQTAFQSRQLQREIAGLGPRATDSSALNTLAPETDLIDIERQITREVETFLQLERETECHLREL